MIIHGYNCQLPKTLNNRSRLSPRHYDRDRSPREMSGIGSDRARRLDCGLEQHGVNDCLGVEDDCRRTSNSAGSVKPCGTGATISPVTVRQSWPGNAYAAGFVVPRKPPANPQGPVSLYMAAERGAAAFIAP